jgi:hypothetical protein
LIADISDRDDPRQFASLFRRFAKPRPGRSKAAERELMIDNPHMEVAEAHDVIAAF